MLTSLLCQDRPNNPSWSYLSDVYFALSRFFPSVTVKKPGWALRQTPLFVVVGSAFTVGQDLKQEGRGQGTAFERMT